jgi:hypothetical protein
MRVVASSSYQVHGEPPSYVYHTNSRFPLLVPHRQLSAGQQLLSKYIMQQSCQRLPQDMMGTVGLGQKYRPCNLLYYNKFKMPRYAQHLSRLG